MTASGHVGIARNSKNQMLKNPIDASAHHGRQCTCIFHVQLQRRARLNVVRVQCAVVALEHCRLVLRLVPQNQLLTRLVEFAVLAVQVTFQLNDRVILKRVERVLLAGERADVHLPVAYDEFESGNGVQFHDIPVGSFTPHIDLPRPTAALALALAEGTTIWRGGVSSYSSSLDVCAPISGFEPSTVTSTAVLVGV